VPYCGTIVASCSPGSPSRPASGRRPHLQFGVASGGADVGLAGAAEQVVARAVAEEVVGERPDRVVLALPLAVGGLAL